MPNEISQAAPLEPITPEAEVPEAATPEVSPQPEPQTEKPLSLDDVRGLLQEEFIPTISKSIQSQVAKGENRMNQRIAERFAALDANKGVLKLSDEQVQAAQQDIIREEQMSAFRPAEPQNNGPQPASPNETVVRQVEFVYEQINGIFDDVGTQVNANDAEWKTVQSALDDPKGSLAKTLRAATKAAEAKSARIATQQKNAPARVISTGGESPSGETPAKSASELWGKAYK